MTNDERIDARLKMADKAIRLWNNGYVYTFNRGWVKKEDDPEAQHDKSAWMDDFFAVCARVGDTYRMTYGVNDVRYYALYHWSKKWYRITESQYDEAERLLQKGYGKALLPSYTNNGRVEHIEFVINPALGE